MGNSDIMPNLIRVGSCLSLTHRDGSRSFHLVLEVYKRTNPLEWGNPSFKFLNLDTDIFFPIMKPYYVFFEALPPSWEIIV
jgi:hypothetical protein